MADKTPPPPEDDSSEAHPLPPGSGGGDVAPEFAETFIQEPGQGPPLFDDSEAPTLPPQVHPSQEGSEAVTLPPQQDDSEAATMVPSHDQETIAVAGETLVEKPDSGDFDPYEAATMAPAEDDATIAEGSSTLADRNAQQTTRFTALPKGAPKAYEGAPQIAGYHIFDRLGEGGMGVVWKAIQIGTRREVALKLLPTSTIGSEKAQIRFQREIKTAAAAEHPYIASIYDSGLDKGVFYYAMQCIDGEELNIYARQAKLDIRESIVLMQKVIRGMQYAHEHDIIHRDLKPGNVMVTPQGDPKLLDFGLAKSTTDVEDSNLSMVGEIMGTPMYMSTEQARGMTDLIDGRTDIYSLGIMLYELITGDFPYSSEGGPFEIIRRKIESDPIRPRSINKDIDIDLEAIVLKSIALDRDDRYATALEMDEDLQRYLEGRPILARRHTFTYVGYKFLKRNRVRIAILLMLVSGIGAGYYVLDQQRRTDVAAQEVETQKLAKEKELLALENAEKIFNEYARSLDGLEAAIGEGDPDGANIHLATLSKIKTPEAAAEIETRFAERRDSLKRQLDTLEVRRTDMQAERAALVKAWADVQTQPLNDLRTLTPAFAQVLTGIQDTFKGSTYLNAEDIAARRRATGDLLLATLTQAIQAKPLATRSDRLTAANKFLTHPGIAQLFPQLAPTQKHAEAAAKICLIEVLNSWDHGIRIQLGADDAIELPKGGKHLVSFTKPSGASVTLQAESVFQTDLHEVLRIELPFTAGAGMDHVVPHFGKRRITVKIDRQDLPVVAFWDINKTGPFNKRVRDTEFLPGSYHFRFKREDYKSQAVEVTLALPKQAATIAAPPADTWELKFHVAKYREADKLFQQGKLNEALKAIATVNTDQLSDEDAGWSEKLQALQNAVNNDPRLLVETLFPVAQRDIDAFLRAFIQVEEPGGSVIKPYRYQKGNVPIPSLDLKTLNAQEMGLLSPAQTMHYEWIKAWQSALSTGNDLDTIRAEAIRILSDFEKQHPARAVDTQAAIAVLSRDAKDKMESGLEDRINHPLIHRWKANVLLKRLSNATIDECLNHLNQAVSQGHADEWDLKLAAFVSARRFNNVATTLRLEGMTPGKPGFREEAASAVKAFAVLEGSFQRADTAAVKSCIAYLDSLTQSNNRMLGTPDWEVGAALAKMTTLPPEKASLCREAKSSAIERHKATLSRPDWEKQNQRVIALETALSQAQ